MACGQDVPGANESSCAPRIYPAQGKRYGFVTLSRVSGRKTLLDALNEKLLATGDTKLKSSGASANWSPLEYISSASSGS